MPSLTVYHVTPPPSSATLALHFGRQGVGYEEASETWSSDALFAALVAQAALLEGLDTQGTAAPLFARPFLTEAPPLRHSSLFPRIGALVLLPRPALPLVIPNPALRTRIGKGFKKLRYLSPALFRAACAGEALADEPLALQGGRVWLTLAEAQALEWPWAGPPRETEAQLRTRLWARPIWTIEQVPHVAIDRATNASAFYEVGRVVFAAGCGLALLVAYHDLAWQRRLEGLLELLGESGMGGKRNSGYGACAFTRAEQGLAFADAPDGGRVALLARYLPRQDEVAVLREPGSAYQLVTIGGWLWSGGVPAQRRQQITMLAEGSVLAPPPGQSLVGQIADVRPDYGRLSTQHPIYRRGVGSPHPVYRSGLALTVAVSAARTAEEDANAHP